jgi:uncharacterized protein
VTTSDLAEKRAGLEEILTTHAPLMVAYSGGVDSTCLLAVAHAVLGDRVVGVIADSASLPRASLAEAMDVARSLGVRVEVIQTTEIDDPAYASNPLNRCYFCKAELFRSMDTLASERGFAAIAYGENADDPAHLRPGSQAAAEFSVIAPLKQAGLTKADVRALSRDLGLPTADAPAQPCLSSRIPHGTPVTREALAYVERGEAAIRALGFRILRVRFLDGEPPGALVLVGPDELADALARADEIQSALQREGFGEVIVDPSGYRSPAP